MIITIIRKECGQTPKYSLRVALEELHCRAAKVDERKQEVIRHCRPLLIWLYPKQSFALLYTLTAISCTFLGKVEQAEKYACLGINLLKGRSQNISLLESLITCSLTKATYTEALKHLLSLVSLVPPSTSNVPSNEASVAHILIGQYAYACLAVPYAIGHFKVAKR
ncbi:uncharacterized protein LOC135145344 [Zophobas morio]|uniref:uncharacterized protein LOC135145344 n=1 Tax=Zophobas morio TaxID=2755281 RepID=UPI003082A4EB